MSPMEENGLAHFKGRSESPSRVKAYWNCLLQMSAFSFASVLRIPFSLSEVIPNASFLGDLINDRIFLGLGVCEDDFGLVPTGFFFFHRKVRILRKECTIDQQG